MTKKIISKLVVVLLCAVLMLPASLTFKMVKADTSIDAYPGVAFSFTVSDTVRGAQEKVSITVSEGSNEPFELYNNGAIKKDSNLVYVLSSYEDGKVTARITKTGTYTFKVKSIKEDLTAEFTKTVTVHGSVDNLKGAKYKYLSGSASDREKLEEYELRAQEASYVGEGENKTSIFVGETYTLPSIENLLDLGSFSYDQYKKAVHYAVPGSTSYSSGNANLSFTITKIGTYRFYVLLSMDKIDGKAFNMVISKLKEYDDGFYSVKRASDDAPLFVSGEKYFLDEDLKEEYIPDNEDTDIEKVELVVPIFEFTIANAGPNLKVTATYQENGYIGLEYKLDSVKVSGNEVSTTYTLKYRTLTSSASDANAWVDATEEFDEDTKTFTPSKEGYYKLVVTAIDNDGIDKTVETKEVKVSQKYQPVEYQTGFSDWISVNYVPFIFLCISGVCLIAIILLLVIKPKQKTEEVKVEEDK